MTNVGLERVGINDLETRMELLRPIMVKSSQLALKLFEDRGELKVEEKSARDYVSDADFKVERHIRELIAKELPHDMVVGEELGGVAGSKYWIIDPIDGTSNHLSGLCIFRDIRPPIPTTSAHLYRGIRPALTRCREALVFDISFLAFRHVVEGLSFGRIVRRVRAGRRCAPAGRGWHLRRWVHQ